MSKCMKELAVEAKKRLKGGYWTNYLERRDEDMDLARRCGVSEDYVARAFRGRAKEELILRKKDDGRERDLYEKVKAMLDCDEIVLDPIGRLIDEGRIEGATEGEIERYILELSGAYVKIKRKIREEEEYNRLISG